MNYSESLITGEGVTMLEALSTGGMTTAVGISIVFGVLVILMIVLYLFKVIFYKDPNKAKKAEATATPVTETVVETTEDEQDEEELVAILTAAVAASLNTSTYNLHIKSYRRVGNNRPQWNKEGLRETIANRF